MEQFEVACVTAKLLDGRAVATEIRSKLKTQIKGLAGSITEPNLVSILVGEYPGLLSLHEEQ
jgi:5,10-methylene-tetrahydrofolate dehydrogenase/methenyl tetrahydrofolate cyclohydrolase